MKIDHKLEVSDLEHALERAWSVSADKIRLIRDGYDTSRGSPVFTADGTYTTRGWTEWTQGFQYGSEILQYDATGDRTFLELGRRATLKQMAHHLTHTGVHDHGFNNVSTYGSLWRLWQEGRLPEREEWERNFYELALKASGAVQAARWTPIRDGGGYIYTFNGPHSLFVDTIRSLRVLALSHRLGHVLYGEQDETISLLGRLIQHARSTAEYNVYYGEGRDRYDRWGRTVHECIFNTNDGRFRCPSSQQGFSPFTTWTRGLAWAMCGFAEQLEFIEIIDDSELDAWGGRGEIESMMLRAARATCDFYIDNTSQDGIPFWDTGAPDFHRLGDYTDRDADPYNEHEPVDSSAAAIGAQGLMRLGRYLRRHGEPEDGSRYYQAGLTVCRSLLDEPYLSLEESHQGFLLHSIYHRPNGWDHIPDGQSIPCGESSMWGDYHLREAMLMLTRELRGDPWYTFFGDASYFS